MLCKHLFSFRHIFNNTLDGWWFSHVINMHPVCVYSRTPCWTVGWCLMVSILWCLPLSAFLYFFCSYWMNDMVKYVMLLKSFFFSHRTKVHHECINISKQQHQAFQSIKNIIAYIVLCIVMMPLLKGSASRGRFFSCTRSLAKVKRQNKLSLDCYVLMETEESSSGSCWLVCCCPWCCRCTCIRVTLHVIDTDFHALFV